MDPVEHCLRAHDFRTLFIEELGWDNLRSGAAVSVNGRTITLDPVAHKRGLQVFACTLPSLDVLNRPLLRQIERAVARYAHEHVIIYADDSKRRQVWQWATRSTANGGLFHREHPFRSVAPPPGFVAQLRGLRVGLDEEDHITIVEVTHRTARAFSRFRQAAPFFRNARYLYESGRLARTMASGQLADEHRFVLFHERLAYWGAARHLQTGCESDDLGQWAVIGLIYAARRFDVSHETAFSTYAFHWIRQACLRYAPQEMTALRIPASLFWRFYRAYTSAEAAWSSGGRDAQRAAWSRFMRDDEELRKHGAWFVRAWRPASLDDPDDPAFRADRWVVDPVSCPTDEPIRDETAQIVQDVVDSLPPRDSLIVRLRYGLNGSPRRTLAEIGAQVGLTRERVRQIVMEALGKLEVRLRHRLAITAPRRSKRHRKRRVRATRASFDL